MPGGPGVASGSGLFNVEDYGARAGNTGAENDAAIARAYTAAQAAKGTVLFPFGSYSIASKIDHPSDVRTLGYGAELVLADGADFPAFDLDGVSNVLIDGVRVRCIGNPGGSCRAVYVRGACDRIRVVRCRATGCGSGFSVRGQNGSVPGTATDVAFVECAGDGALQTYGFDCGYCNGVEYQNCVAKQNYLDGFKLQSTTKNVRIIGGTAKKNGQSPSDGGDGVDAFAGGDTFVIDGLACVDNLGNGITIKTDSLTRDDPAQYGYVRNLQVDNVICTGNLLWGLGIYVDTGSINEYNDNPPLYNAATIPVPIKGSVNGGYFYANNDAGIYCNATGIAFNSPICRANGHEGIQMGLRSTWCVLNSPQLIGNGTVDGSAYQLRLRGRHIRVYYPVFFGVDPDIVRTDADLTGTPPSSGNVVCDSGGFAQDIEIHQPMEDPTSQGTIFTSVVSGTYCAFHQSGDGDPSGVAWGGPGSTWVRKNPAEGRDVFWAKVHGDADAPAVGWYRSGPGSLEDANATHKDWALGSLTQAFSGLTILATSLGGAVVTDVAGGLKGGWQYSLSGTLYLFAGGAAQVRVASGALFPDAAGKVLGLEATRWAGTFSDAYSGNFESSPASLGFSWYATIDDTESVALPDSNSRKGRTYFVEQIGAATSTIGRAGGNTINGAAANFTLNAGELAMCVADGAGDWRVKVIG